MSSWSRREAFVAGSVALLTGCASRLPAPPDGGLRQALVDVHCHCFNASDIPARAFLRIVFLHLAEEQGQDTTANLRDGDFLDWLLELFVGYIAGDAPTAAQELSVLDGLTPAPMPDAAVTAVADFMEGAPPRRLPPASAMRSLRGRGLVLASLETASRSTTRGRRSLEATGRAETEARAARAIASRTALGRYLQWFKLFARYRHDLVDELAGLGAANGATPRLLSPAMVDYSYWLDEEVRSPLIEQVRVWGKISARPTGPAVHGYVAFDPLRELYRPGEAIAVVEEAFDRHGFLGVKLYPPMGFRPWGNAGAGLSYPQRVIDDLGPNIGGRIDDALARLYAACIQRDAPILAHCSPGNEAAKGYGARADPWFWQEALAAFPGLRVCLAHYGGFANRSAAFEGSVALPQASWEWAAGAAAGAPGQTLFLDISYFTEAQNGAAARRATAASIHAWMRRFDPDCRSLVFGTDWIMLASEQGQETYVRQVLDFLRVDLRLTPEQVDRVCYENALRFAGLTGSNPQVERLLRFYEAAKVDPSRLPRLG